MRAADVNPYIRYAARVQLFAWDTPTMAYDCRLLYITNGSCTIYIGGSPYTLSGGDLAVWRPGTEYRFTEAEACEGYIINFDFTRDNSDLSEVFPPSASESFDSVHLIAAPEFTDCGVLNMPIIRRRADGMRSSIRNLCGEFNQKKVFYSEICGAKLKEIIFDILREMLFPSSSTSEMLDTVLNYIKEHYRENITNESLGALIGYHSYYINKLMLDYVHTTLHQYLLNYRMEVAQGMLLNPDKTIGDIARECGFGSIYYFSRYFKKKTGVSPAQYRKLRHSMI